MAAGLRRSESRLAPAVLRTGLQRLLGTAPAVIVAAWPVRPPARRQVQQAQGLFQLRVGLVDPVLESLDFHADVLQAFRHVVDARSGDHVVQKLQSVRHILHDRVGVMRDDAPRRCRSSRFCADSEAPRIRERILADLAGLNIVGRKPPVVDRLIGERPQLAVGRSSYTFYPGTQEVPVNAAANIMNRPYSITADVEIKEGDEGVLISQGGIDGGWIDVHENAGKRSGGYSNGVYDTPPFILLNWADQLGDTFTLAHELGHSMHSWLSVHNQPFVYGDYPIFTAEVASTFNELLVMDHLLKTGDDRQRKLYLLDYHLSQINNTVFRQTMFAEFEHRIHKLGEEGQTLTTDSLGELYQELLVKYWGPSVEFDPVRSPLTWCRIPHFFYNYYVYQYATAYSAAVALSRKVMAGGVTPASRPIVISAID